MIRLSGAPVRPARRAAVLGAALMLAGCGSTPPPDPPTTGTLQVVAHTEGLGLDLDGYAVRLDQGTPQSVMANGAVTFEEVSPGLHAVHLADAADNCELADADTVVSVEAGDSSVLDVAVQCHIDLRGRLVISTEAFGLPQLLALRPDGTQRYRLFSDQFSNAVPALFPDGSRLVYGSYRSGRWRLFLFEAATGAISALPPIGDMDLGPAVSPDGTQIAFEVMTLDVAGNAAFRIWVMAANGASPTALTTGGPSELSDASPAWSPDGQWIVFSRTGTLYKMHPDGSMLTLVPCSPGPCGHPAWSPDGSALAYTGLSDETGDGIGDNYDVYVMDFASGGVRRLTTSLDQEDAPRWSPDGTALAYQRVVQGRIQVFRIQADGTEAVNLTNLPITDAEPAWGPLP